MRERHKIGDSGLAILSGFIESEQIEIDMDFIGLPFENETDIERMKSKIMAELRGLVRNIRQGNDFNYESFNDRARLTVRRTLSDRFIKKPVVISRVTLFEDPNHGLDD